MFRLTPRSGCGATVLLAGARADYTLVVLPGDGLWLSRDHPDGTVGRQGNGARTMATLSLTPARRAGWPGFELPLLSSAHRRAGNQHVTVLQVLDWTEALGFDAPTQRPGTSHMHRLTRPPAQAEKPYLRSDDFFYLHIVFPIHSFFWEGPHPQICTDAASLWQLSRSGGFTGSHRTVVMCA
jgi:hypothetical protein